MALVFAGKASPDISQIKRCVDGDFKFLEVYVTQEHYENDFGKILIDAKKKFGIEFCAIHTPHVSKSLFPKYLSLTEKVANKVGMKTIVMHDAMLGDMFTEDILKLAKPNMAIENSFDTSSEKLQEAINRGFKICFDSAHFYIASNRLKFDYYSEVENIFKNFGAGIRHIHLNNAKKEIDNLPVDDGDIDFKKILKILNRFYSGIVVIETQNESQIRDKEALEKILKHIS